MDYDGEVQINPFAKIHWGTVQENYLNGKLFVDNDKNYGIIGSEAKTSREVKDFSNQVVGQIKVGDVCIKRFFYKEGHKESVVNHISKMRESTFGDRDVWFTHINMEHEGDKAVAKEFDATWLYSKIDAVAAEVRGVY